MNEICISAFSDKAVIPNEKMVEEVLETTASLWQQLQNQVAKSYPEVKGEWKHYGKAAGWIYKLYSGKRNLLFFIPQKKAFRLRLVFGEKAIKLLLSHPDLPQLLKEDLKNARAYAEGRSIDIDINDQELLPVVGELIKIKYEN